LLAEVRQLAEVMEPLPLPQPVSRDPDDDHALALAVAAQVDCIVSGDRDLLSLKAFRDIPIITPAEAIRIITAG
jgi:putative PIN family toxin of toxin-antitoxin system